MAQYDVILFGASGFTGTLALEHLLQKPGLRFAICGRNREKLERKIEGATSKPDVFVLDVVSASQDDVEEVVKKAKCVATAIGPFIEYGEPLVKACAKLGVDYVDTSGESTFFRMMIEKYDAQAKETGARIVMHCGQDCVPWDLLVWKLWKHLGGELTGVKILSEIKSRPSNGTLQTAMLNMKSKPPRGGLGFDPLYLVDGQKSDCGTKVSLPKGSQFYEEAGANGSPWIMGPVMANAVRRTNALLKMAPDLEYHEALLDSSDVGMTGMFQVAFGVSLHLPFTMGLWRKLGALPEEGGGPTKEEMEQGFMSVTGYASTKGKSPSCKGVMRFHTDPGYKDTARMFAEAALALNDLPKSERAGGVLSPAAACGEKLFDRLVAGGTTWELTEL